MAPLKQLLDFKASTTVDPLELRSFYLALLFAVAGLSVAFVVWAGEALANSTKTVKRLNYKVVSNTSKRNC